MGRRPLQKISETHRRRLIKRSIFKLTNIRTCFSKPVIASAFQLTQDQEDLSGSIENHSLIRNFEELTPFLSEEFVKDPDALQNESFATKSHQLVLDFSQQLRKWSLEYKITHSATTSLLKLLKLHKCFQHFPTDSRTLLETPVKTSVRKVDPGFYCHLGIANGIRKVIIDSVLPRCLNIQFNVDGLPIHKSSNRQLWPILGCIVGHTEVFDVGIYEGDSAPQDVNTFLQDIRR